MEKQEVVKEKQEVVKEKQEVAKEKQEVAKEKQGVTKVKQQGARTGDISVLHTSQPGRGAWQPGRGGLARQRSNLTKEGARWGGSGEWSSTSWCHLRQEIIMKMVHELCDLLIYMVE